jgi:hypothetical protein
VSMQSPKGVSSRSRRSACGALIALVALAGIEASPSAGALAGGVAPSVSASYAERKPVTRAPCRRGPCPRAVRRAVRTGSVRARRALIALGVRGVERTGRVAFPFTAPARGTVRATAAVQRGAGTATTARIATVLVGQRAFARRSKRTVLLRLTRQGRHALARVGALRLTLQLAFVRPGGATFTVRATTRLTPFGSGGDLPLTPGSNRAVIFDVWTGVDEKGRNAAIADFTAVAGQHGYDVVTVKDERLRSRPRSPERAAQPTIERFIELGEANVGLLYIGTHGSRGALVVEAYDNYDAARGKVDRLYAEEEDDGVVLGPRRTDAGKLEGCVAADGETGAFLYGICVTAKGIDKYFADSDTIVHVAACNSAALAPAFGAREFFGYAGQCGLGADRDVYGLWWRMDGLIGSGAFRTAEQAHANGWIPGPVGHPISPVFRHVPGGRGTTVLSPSVASAAHDHGAVLRGPAKARIAFDAVMDTTTWPAASVVTVDEGGCAAIEGAPEWTGDGLAIELSLTPVHTGSATLRVRSANAPNPHDGAYARSGNGLLATAPALDGNRIGENGDEFRWTIECGDPGVTISDAAVIEGDSGTVDAVFTVSLTQPSSETITVDYGTIDATATAAPPAPDYTAVGGTLEFLPGQTTATVAVPVRGDVAEELDEHFAVGLARSTKFRDRRRHRNRDHRGRRRRPPATAGLRRVGGHDRRHGWSRPPDRHQRAGRDRRAQRGRPRGGAGRTRRHLRRRRRRRDQRRSGARHSRPRPHRRHDLRRPGRRSARRRERQRQARGRGRRRPARRRPRPRRGSCRGRRGLPLRPGRARHPRGRGRRRHTRRRRGG